MSFIIIALVVAAGLVGLYLLAHKLKPEWGSFGVAGGLGLGSVAVYLDQALALANSLPWASILTPDRAAAVLFGVAAAVGAMKIARDMRNKKAG